MEGREMAETVSPAVAGLGLGIALASAPGPVQAVLLSESIRGGVARGFRAMAGASVTFGLLLLALALGLSVAAPSGTVLRVLEVVGGALLIVLAVDGFRSAGQGLEPANGERRELPPVARGSLAVLLNPGAWLFLGTAASSLFAAATQEGGTDAAVLAAVALLFGLMLGDGAVVLLGGLGVRRAGERVALWVRRGLAVVLAALGVALVVRGVVS
jgi:threonine/homoserine/homoserine lactone efflux protein